MTSDLHKQKPSFEDQNMYLLARYFVTAPEPGARLVLIQGFT